MPFRVFMLGRTDEFARICVLLPEFAAVGGMVGATTQTNQYAEADLYDMFVSEEQILCECA